jgi:D-alanine-D-alanine ligase
MSRKRVAVLMGGMSSEHEVSLHSGAMALAALDPDRYAAVPVCITKEGIWQFPDASDLTVYDAVDKLQGLRLDCILLALHGAFGEDGRLQGFLDVLNIPYTSSGCSASAIAFDKICAKAVVQTAGVPVAPQQIIRRAKWDADHDAMADALIAEFGLPLVVKSPCQGSSVGMAIPRTREDLLAALPTIFAFDTIAMVEMYINGPEVTCGVLDVDVESGMKALPVTEIRPVSSAFFDYEAKYTPGASVEITPAEIGEEMTARVQDYALRAHRAIGCEIWSRTDFMIGPNGPVYLETNTIPGMTQTSLFPQGAAAIGISYPELLTLFIESAISRRVRKGKHS